MKIIADAGKFGDFVKRSQHVATGEAHQTSAEENVVVAGNFTVHAQGDSEHRRHASVNAYGSRDRFIYSSDNLEQCGFAGAVVSDQPDAIAFEEFEAQVVESPDDNAI